ncbi:aspartyl/asparaginyl beta-hydroxylase domain-containing protein [Streptomyces virginiae]|uniref:aspartyl/asparaginyl beta-hydroxylase domain-containing protein n=1 Tax=Streptomyces virginiae TaxID=1961 RepID=UPI00367B3805
MRLRHHTGRWRVAFGFHVPRATPVSWVPAGRRCSREPARAASGASVSTAPVLPRGEWTVPGPHSRARSGLSCTPGSLRPRGRGSWGPVRRRRVEPQLRRPPRTRHPLGHNQFERVQDSRLNAFSERALHRCGPNRERPLRLNAARLRALGPGAVGERHGAPKHRLARGCVHLHIPLTANPDAVLYLDGTEHTCQSGEFWYGDFSREHAVRNLGTTTRLHAVMNVLFAIELPVLFPPARQEQLTDADALINHPTPLIRTIPADLPRTLRLPAGLGRLFRILPGPARPARHLIPQTPSGGTPRLSGHSSTSSTRAPLRLAMHRTGRPGLTRQDPKETA